MPRGDGTGPTGKGPMTGRGMGFCVRTFETGETSYIGGGIRRGFRRWFGRGCTVMNASAENKKEFLEDEKNFLQRRLESLEKELEKMNQKNRERKIILSLLTKERLTCQDR